MQGRITDNSKRLVNKVFESDKAISSLTHISNTPIKELINSNPNLLVFPDILGNSIDSNQNICSLYENGGGTWLETNNLMGFISSHNHELSIHSRFYSHNNDFFLHYMLQRVFDINVLEMNYSSDNENIWEFLIYLFPYFFKQALQQGVYKEYVKQQYNDINVRGTIDVNRHIKKNIPFNGKIAYNVKEYSYDNPITQLIRHTIHYIRSYKYSGNILNNDVDTQNGVKVLCDCTPSFDSNDKRLIIEQNRKVFNHPFYTDYAPLQQLCMAILTQDSFSYGDNKDKTHGLLFDGAWLWEEYLGTILIDYIHTDNRTRKGRISLFHDFRGIYPDFYKLEKEKVTQVLDAKYKVLENDNREDYYQLLSYMFRLNTGNGYFLYPIDEEQMQSKVLTLSSDLIAPAIDGASILKIGFPISMSCDDYLQFSKIMEEKEFELISILDKSF